MDFYLQVVIQCLVLEFCKNAVQVVDIKKEVNELGINQIDNAVKFILEYTEIIQGEKAGTYTRMMA